jgi:hypothetical protein
MLTQLLAASCRLLRRHLENGAGEAILPSPIPAGRKAGAAAAPELVPGSEMSRTFEAPGIAMAEPSLRAVEDLVAESARIFEAAGVAITEPSLRAVEELVAESARRHEEHRARMAGIDAAADEAEERLRRRLLAGQQQQPQAVPHWRPVRPVPPVNGGGGDDLAELAGRGRRGSLLRRLLRRRGEGDLPDVGGRRRPGRGDDG